MTLLLVITLVLVTALLVALNALLAVACHEREQLRASVLTQTATIDAVRMALVGVDQALAAVARAIEEHGTTPVDVSALVMSLDREDQMAAAVGRALSRRRN